MKDMIKIITSETLPIKVDLLPAETIGLPGNLGLTLAPGVKHTYNTEIWDRDLDKDLEYLRDQYHIDLLVTLLEEHEFESLYIPTFRERVKAHGINHICFPITDTSVPSSIDEFAKLVKRIVHALSEGHTVIIHCMAGLGRTGLVAASCLTSLGFTPQEAISKVREARPGAVKPPQQEEFVTMFKNYIDQ